MSTLATSWSEDPRWQGISRDYSADDVSKLQGSVQVEHTLARLGAEKLWQLLQQEAHLTGMGIVTGNQAMQQVQAGLQMLYVSGWQIAADNNTAGSMYPDLGLYPANSGPQLVARINQTLLAKDRASTARGDKIDWLKPIVIDAEAGFGGVLNVFELTKQLIQAGISGIHFEDQAPSYKRCGHLGGKVVTSTHEMLQKLKSARLAADVFNVPTVIIARTDSYGAKYITSDHDPLDQPFINSEQRTPDGLFTLSGSMDHAIARAKAFAPYVDMLWCETGKPDLAEARQFAEAIHAEFPGKPLIYNCSPSFNWQKHLSVAEIKSFQSELAKLGYKIQLITLAGFHSINSAMYELAYQVVAEGLPAYVKLQQQEFALADKGFDAHKHQQAVGVDYFETVLETVTNCRSEISSAGTESQQF